MSERSAHDVPRWLPLALLAGTVLTLYRAIFAGETFFWGLPTLQFYPWREFAFAELRAGRLPAWNPYLGAGVPLLANYQTAIFYPPNWLMLLLPGPLAMSLVALLHILWAGLGMWLMTGALGYSPFGRGISALSYALSGYLIARLGSFPTHDAAAWLPWVLWLVCRLLARQRGRDLAGLGLAVGLLLLAGHAQTAWYGLLGAGAFALWLTVWGRLTASWRRRARGLILIAAGFALGAGIAAVQLLPTAEYLRHSDRASGVDYERLTNLSYHPARLIALFAPNFFGSPADGSYYTEGAYFEDAAYVGVIPLIAAGAAVLAWARARFFARRRGVGTGLETRPHNGVPAALPAATLKTVPFWAGLALIGLFFALGKYSPTFRFFYDHVPTFDAFREPVRWLILTELSLAALAGIGVEQWRRGPRTVFWSRLAAAGGGGMAAMALGARIWGNLPLPELETMALAVAATGAWIAVAALLTLVQPLAPATTTPRPLWRATVLLAVTLDLAWFADGLNPTTPASFFERRAEVVAAGRVYWFDEYQHDLTFGTDEDEEEKPPVEGFFDLGDYRIAVRRRDELRASLLPNITVLDRVYTLDNNDPLLPELHSRYVSLIEGLGTDASALLQAAGVTRAFGITPDGWRGSNPAIAPDADGATAWLVPEAVWAASDEEVVAALRDPAWNPTETVILAEAPSASLNIGAPVNDKSEGVQSAWPSGLPHPCSALTRLAAPSPYMERGRAERSEAGGEVRSPNLITTLSLSSFERLPAGAVQGTETSSSGSVRLLKEYPAERRFRVTTDTPAYLVFAETWYPGWSATVNGTSVPILRANLAFQTVAVPAGESEVIFRYRINHFATGAGVSALALLIALLLLRPRRSSGLLTPDS